VRRSWAGKIVVLLILGGVLLVLGLSLDLSRFRTSDTGAARSAAAPADQPGTDRAVIGRSPEPLSGETGSARRSAPFREYPIGEEVEKNQMRIAAVWLPPVEMDGVAGPSTSTLIHLEADIHAMEGNRNGFPKDEFVPYLTVRYMIVPVDEAAKSAIGGPIRGTLMPMMARDGWHYGASIEMPKPGHFKLTYAIDPPSAGRHSDPVTGVDPWWKPFEVSFDWDYPGPPTTAPEGAAQ
jgi:uncharacterized protein involved in high-affinity Fe2+ transport